MRGILAPHRDQDGWAYVRVRRTPWRRLGRVFYSAPGNLVSYPPFLYDDSQKQARTISSRRVESDVETGDYLRRCAEEGLTAVFGSTHYAETGLPIEDMLWWVGKMYHGEMGDEGKWAPTLREAYFRYHAAVDK